MTDETTTVLDAADTIETRTITPDHIATAAQALAHTGEARRVLFATAAVQLERAEAAAGVAG